MRNFKFIYIGFVLMTMSACSKSGTGEIGDSVDIRLGAAVGDIQVGSRTTAEPYLGSTPIQFNSEVWFSNTSGVYENNPSATTSLPVHTAVTFKGPQLEYVYYGSKNIQYPTDDTEVYCVGFYPNDGDWKTSDNTNVSHPIDGIDDLMFAKQIAGTWNNHFGTLRYEHLLTWVKIAVCATSHDTADAWGDIEEISINSKSNVSIDLKSGKCTYGGDTRAISTMSAAAPLLTTMHEVGSVLCSPETEYTLTIKTSNNADPKQITLKLSLISADGDLLTEVSGVDQARGKCFVLSLYFKPYNVIDGVCVLNAWNNENEDIYLTAE